MPSRGDRPNARTLEDLEDLDPISETDEELVQLTVRARKWVRKRLGQMKLDREVNIEDLVDEALREYIERHE